MKKKALSLLLALALCLTLLPTAALAAKDTPEPEQAETAPVPQEEPAPGAEEEPPAEEEQEEAPAQEAEEVPVPEEQAAPTAEPAPLAADTMNVGVYLRTLDSQQTDSPSKSNFVNIPTDQLKALGLVQYYDSDRYGYWISYGTLQSAVAASYEQATCARDSDEVQAVVNELGGVKTNSGITMSLPAAPALTWDTLSWSDSSWHLNGELHFYTVTLALNYTGADSSDASLTRYELVGTATSSGLPEDPSRSDYTFAGWYTEADGGEKVTAIPVLTGNVTYYAHWTETDQPAGGHPDHPICGMTCDHEPKHPSLHWTPISSKDALLHAAGGTENAKNYYYLTDDITLDEAWSPNPYIVLDLCGHDIIQANTSNARVIYIENNSSLTITDCQDSGEITHVNGTMGCGVQVHSGTFTMFGGTISGNTSSSSGGGVLLSAASSDTAAFNMYGGTISGNTAGNKGGGVCMFANSSFTLYDGTISGNTAVEGGGVYVNEDRTFTMSGGTISNNRAYNEDNRTYGGGVCSDGTFIMDGGTVSGNTATEGGGVYVGYGKAAFSMTAGTIEKNTAVDGGGVSNNGTFTMSGGTIGGTDLTAANTASNEGGGVRNAVTFTMSGSAAVTCNKAAGNKRDSRDGEGGGVFNNGTFTMSGSASVSGNQAVRAEDCPEDETNIGTGGGVYNNNGTFTLESGSVSGNTAAIGAGGVYNYSNFIMKGGTVSDNQVTNENCYGGGVFNYSAFTMSGGTISGNRAGFGGGIYQGGSKMELNGGTVRENTAVKSGGGLFYADDATLNGVVITGNTAGENGGGTWPGYVDNITLTLSGATQVWGNAKGGNMYVRSSQPLTIGTLASGAKLGVTTNRTPQSDNESIVIATGANEGDAAYFQSDASGFQVAYESGKLVLKKGGSDTPASHTHDLCGETHQNIGDHTAAEEVTFATELKMDNGTLMKGGSEWTKSTIKRADGGADSSAGYALTEGAYYLDTDLTLTGAAILIDGDVKLCLNGHTIDRANNTGAVDYVIWVLGKNAHLTLTDCVGGGELTGGKYGGVDIFGSCTLDMFGGIITGNEYNGGVNVGQGGTFNMYGGKITGNSAEYSGGGVRDCGTVNMYGGEITGNSAKNYGGGVYVDSYPWVSFKISGAAKITGNTDNDGAANNVYLSVGKTFVLGSGFTRDTDIGVTTAVLPEKDKPVTVATGAGELDYTSVIKSDNSDYEIKQTGSTLVLAISGDDGGKTDAGVSISAPTAKTYGDGAFTVTAKAANSGAAELWGWQSSDPSVLKVSDISGAAVTIEVVGAGSATLTATYTSTTTEGRATVNITVGKAAVTVAAKDQSIYVGGTAPDLSAPTAGTHYTVSGLVGGDTLTGTLTMAYQKNGETVTPDTSKAGTYDIVISGVSEPAGGNYEPIVLRSGTLTVTNRASSSGGGSSTPTYPVNVPSKAANGSVSSSVKNASKGSTVTVTVRPDSGYVLDELTVTDKDGNFLKLTDKGSGVYTFTMPAGKVAVSASFVKETETSSFGDVPADAYYREAVKWAAEQGITGGTSATTFSPADGCTRAQIVTFLWRAAGSPEPKNTASFADVPADAYYAKAVAWAVENGIALGTTDTAFSPDAPCTRAQAVTFLYRLVQSEGKGFTGAWMFLLPFTDTPEWAYESVAWCYMNGITLGTTDTTFSPAQGCTRAQIVTFLWRLYTGK